ncbi:MAG: DUF2851 family protein [Planctomycetia bacterium]|nr:DUF2851 family protein [Planctomycetia bacterium]
MEYLLSNISYKNDVSEPANLYEIDLVKQWLNLSPGTIVDTVNSGTITILNAGIFNKHEGPDIKAAILIINNKVVKGSIECHICTSDWYKHNHHQNPAYQSVILHIVRRLNDGIITPTIPTALLKLDNNNSIECSLNIINKSPQLINTIIDNSHNRWINKVNLYNGYHDNPEQLKKLLIINSFRILGAGGNKTQFAQLANSINYKKIRYFNLEESEQYLWNTSLQLTIKWVKRGIRPAQQPQNRMKLAAELIYYFSNLNFDRLPSFNNVTNLLTTNFPSAGGISVRSELLGNIIIPFYAARALYLNKIGNYQKYYEIWNCLKIQNIYRKFVRRFRNIIDLSQLKSFPMLQGLIAIDNNWCSKHLCHLCPLKEKSYVVS